MCSGLVIADAPSDNGCCSGNALLPGIVVVTGMSSISAKRTSSALASANNTPCPANTTGCFAASSASHRFTHRGRIRTGPRTLHRHVVEFAFEFRRHRVDRRLDQHRSAATGAQPVERVTQRRRNAIDVGHERTPLRDVAVVVVRTEHRRDALPLRRFAGRQHQHRHVVGERLRDTGERVLRAGTLLAHEHAEPLAVRGTAEAVGNRDSHAFLTAHDRADADLRARLDQIVVRIAGDELHAFPLQDLRDDLQSFHCLPLRLIVRPVAVLVRARARVR